jgi:hypothetical protein
MLFARLMRITALTNILGILSLAGWGQCHTAAAGTERFASVQYIQTIHAPAGIELVLNVQGQQLSAVLRDYEGNPTPLETRLAGKLDACQVMLTGRNRRGSVEISGQITIAAFKGSIRRQIGNRWFSETVSLRRKLSEPSEFLPSVFSSFRNVWKEPVYRL